MNSTVFGPVDSNLLWSPAQLAEALDRVVVLDVRLGEAFSMGHIKGARHFSVYGVNTYDSDPAPLSSFAKMWAFLLSQRGISPKDTVVVCGNVSGMSAARAVWFLHYLGYNAVHLLDGGFTGWKDAGMPVERDAILPKPVALDFDCQPDRVASYADVLLAIDDPNAVILDTRSYAEWTGEDGRAERNGTIPSAVHQDWNAHLTDDGTLKAADELAQLFTGLGITPRSEVIAFCNTGYRSAHAYVALRLIGHRKVRNYVGSWQEWGNRPGCPVIVPS